MRAISIRCPECGARLSVSADARESNCEYCGTKSQIQRRTGFFERAEPKLKHSVNQSLPVATQQHSAAWTISLVVVPVFVIGFALSMVMTLRARHRGVSATQAPTANDTGRHTSIADVEPTPQLMSWNAGAGAMVDVNGDGSLDVLGRIVLTSERHKDDKLAAFDGRTGQPLWMSEELALRSHDTPGDAVVAGQTVIFAPSSSSLRSFALASGTSGWIASLPEALNQMCRGKDEESVTIQTADKRWYRLALADGSLEALEAGEPCRLLESDSTYLSRSEQLHIDEPFKYGKMALGNAEGMRARAGIFDTRSKLTIALAIKTPGSEVPMLARYELSQLEERIAEGELAGLRIETPAELRNEVDRKWHAANKKLRVAPPTLLWSTAIPSRDPLEAKKGAPTHRQVAVQDDVVVALYETEGGQYLTAFNATDGTRLWEISLEGVSVVTRIKASPDHVFVFRYGTVRVFGLRDGQAAYSIPGTAAD